MYATQHPSVLANDWLPPVLNGRAGELAELSRRLGDPYPPGPPPWVAVVVGPSGAGTSAVARLGARRLLEAVNREGSPVSPALVRVRVSETTGIQGVAAGLLQGLDSGFVARGFPVAEIVAGFLRRLARDGRAAVVVLDDIGPGAPDLGPVVRALLAPTRFLPEGCDTAPTLWTILAGRADAEATWSRLLRAGVPRESQIVVPTPEPSTIRAAVADRASRALGHAPPPELVERVVVRSLREGRGIGRALDLLRRELLGAGPQRAFPLSPNLAGGRASVEPRILAALERATRGRPATLGEIRAWEVRLAAQEGARPLPATTLWRRMVRLQAAGVIRRDVRPGGPGGTRSTIELIGPVPFYALRAADQTLLGSGPRAGAPSGAGPRSG
ncbi:MAG: hypothetical protein L3J80_02580 [Thermoplasmata archaeon]|nr:hypothetical protein [Thermoplasmata archaeon]